MYRYFTLQLWYDSKHHPGIALTYLKCCCCDFVWVLNSAQYNIEDLSRSNKMFAVPWLDETDVRSAVISARPDRWECKQRCLVTQWPVEVLSLLRKKKKFVSWPLSYLRLYITPDSFFSGRGYDCSWEDFVSKSQSCLQWYGLHLMISWLNCADWDHFRPPWPLIPEPRSSFWVRITVATPLPLSFTHIHTLTQTQSIHSSCRLSQLHVWFSRSQRWTSGVCGNTEASSYCLTMTLLWFHIEWTS